jgi:NAD+ kinase
VSHTARKRAAGRRPAPSRAAATPKGAVRRVVLFGKVGVREGPRIASELAAWLSKRGIEVALDEDIARALKRGPGVPRGTMPQGTDLAVVAGGDGTLLSVARAAAPHGVPILAVNFGGLGFLTELQPDELYEALPGILRGEGRIEERRMLRVRRRGVARRKGSEHAVLNDAVITKSALARMITLDLRVDGDEVATYTSDGLIVATPTGSTAYNLSAGGPILDPRVQAMVVTPICPHTMTYRPLVVPDTVQVEIVLKHASDTAYLTLDGQVGFPLDAGDVVTVDGGARPVRLLRVARRGYFEVLHRKLRWGER